MDATATVAVGTLLITTGANIWLKLIENQQKTKEHSLSLRSAYVTRKIQSGEELASLLHQKNLLYLTYYQFYNFYKQTGSPHLGMAKRSKEKTIAFSELLDKTNHSLIYFNYQENGQTILNLESIVNQNIEIINRAVDLEEATPENKERAEQDLKVARIALEEQEIEKILESVPLLTRLYNDEINKIRTELAKYDIL